jgi:hypothetical protein
MVNNVKKIRNKEASIQNLKAYDLTEFQAYRSNTVEKGMAIS